jgi:hypothetical protein
MQEDYVSIAIGLQSAEVSIVRQMILTTRSLNRKLNGPACVRNEDRAQSGQNGQPGEIGPEDWLIPH